MRRLTITQKSKAITILAHEDQINRFKYGLKETAILYSLRLGDECYRWYLETPNNILP